MVSCRFYYNRPSIYLNLVKDALFIVLNFIAISQDNVVDIKEGVNTSDVGADDDDNWHSLRSVPGKALFHYT